MKSPCWLDTRWTDTVDAVNRERVNLRYVILLLTRLLVQPREIRKTERVLFTALTCVYTPARTCVCVCVCVRVCARVQVFVWLREFHVPRAYHSLKLGWSLLDRVQISDASDLHEAIKCNDSCIFSIRRRIHLLHTSSSVIRVHVHMCNCFFEIRAIMVQILLS